MSLKLYLAQHRSIFLGYGLKSWVTSSDLTSDEFSVQLEPLIKGLLQEKNRYYNYEINDRYILTPKGIFVAQDSNDSNNWVQLSCIISDHRYGT